MKFSSDFCIAKNNMPIIIMGDYMCTAILFKNKDSYFGRNLDLEYSYNETVTITPRNYKFEFMENKSSYAMIGMAYVSENYPLYYDAINEKGVGMAGLNFPHNAYYTEKDIDGKINIASFEFIPFVLSQCSSVFEAKELLKQTNLVNRNFSENLKATPLHWIIADKTGCITVESMKTGLIVHENHAGVLTNNPPFEFQLENLSKYSSLTSSDLADMQNYTEFYSRGLGAVGLPGDWSSVSRFVRAKFVKDNSICNDNENECVNQFFHILSSVEMPRGCLRVGDKNAITVYSSCCNLNEGIYYYKTYGNTKIYFANLFNENLNGTELIKYPLNNTESFSCVNPREGQ